MAYDIPVAFKLHSCRLTEFAVITTTPNAQRRIYSASMLEISKEESWVLMKISPQNATEVFIAMSFIPTLCFVLALPSQPRTQDDHS